jgi:hypothetical protein
VWFINRVKAIEMGHTFRERATKWLLSGYFRNSRVGHAAGLRNRDRAESESFVNDVL